MSEHLKSCICQDLLRNLSRTVMKAESTLPDLPCPCAANACDCPLTGRGSRCRCAARRIGRGGVARGEVHPGHQLHRRAGLPLQPAQRFSAPGQGRLHTHP